MDYARSFSNSMAPILYHAYVQHIAIVPDGTDEVHDLNSSGNAWFLMYIVYNWNALVRTHILYDGHDKWVPLVYRKAENTEHYKFYITKINDTAVLCKIGITDRRRLRSAVRKFLEL